jgi:hypothetical protein
LLIQTIETQLSAGTGITDYETALDLLKAHGDYPMFYLFSPKLRDNPQFIKDVISLLPHFYVVLSEKFRADGEIFLTALQHHKDHPNWEKSSVLVDLSGVDKETRDAIIPLIITNQPQFLSLLPLELLENSHLAEWLDTVVKSDNPDMNQFEQVATLFSLRQLESSVPPSILRIGIDSYIAGFIAASVTLSDSFQKALIQANERDLKDSDRLCVVLQRIADRKTQIACPTLDTELSRIFQENNLDTFYMDKKLASVVSQLYSLVKEKNTDQRQQELSSRDSSVTFVATTLSHLIRKSE